MPSTNTNHTVMTIAGFALSLASFSYAALDPESEHAQSLATFSLTCLASIVVLLKPKNLVTSMRGCFNRIAGQYPAVRQRGVRAHANNEQSLSFSSYCTSSNPLACITNKYQSKRTTQLIPLITTKMSITIILYPKPLMTV